MAKLSLKQAEARLMAFGLTFPEAVLDHPWGHNALKVNGKLFATFGSVSPTEFSMTVKLPISAEMALTLPWTAPAGYGLGKSGWITARFQAGDDVDLVTLKGWLAQIYRAVAPKRLAKLLA